LNPPFERIKVVEALLTQKCRVYVAADTSGTVHLQQTQHHHRHIKENDSNKALLEKVGCQICCGEPVLRSFSSACNETRKLHRNKATRLVGNREK
jgi:hypothetical protein